MPADTWTAALETAGFVEARAWPPRDSIAGDLGQHVIVARAPGDNTGVQHARTHEPLLRPHTDNVSVLVDETSVRAALSALIATERVAMMCDLVRREVTRILRLDPSMQPARHDRLMDLGMDSLMAVQLRNALSLRLELTDPLSPTLIFDYPTIDAIASLLLDRLDLACEPLVASPAITHGSRPWHRRQSQR